nr:cinnamoyl-CoA reductase 2-like [Setaria viridis]
MAAPARSTVCVTGAGGFVASWLVKLLLSTGRYAVRGTVRDPSGGKNAHLMALEGAGERLRLVKADVLDHSSVASAIAGCDGVFHVASPVPSGPCPEADVLAPTVTGTLNVLKACYEAKVKRVVVVSSFVAVGFNPKWPKGIAFSEDSWSDEEYCRKHQEFGWYFLSKTLAEREAFAYAAKTGLDVVTVCPTLVIGPLMQSSISTSVKIFLNYIKDEEESVEHKFEHFVDVRDVADALLLAYENPKASGRYLCSSALIRVSDIVNILKNSYPTYNYHKNFVEAENSTRCNTEKLEKLGWSSRPMEKTLHDSIESCRALGILN